MYIIARTASKQACILFTGGPNFQNHFQILPSARKHPNLKLRNSLGFPGDSDGQESTCSAGDLGSIPGLGRSPGEGHGNPLQYSSLENLHGQRSLVGYSPWGRKESDTTKHTQFPDQGLNLEHCKGKCQILTTRHQGTPQNNLEKEGQSWDILTLSDFKITTKLH